MAMLTTPEKLVFLLLIAATAAAFFLPVIRRLRIVLAGRPDGALDRPAARLSYALKKVLLQLCTLRVERPFTGLFHAFIFYSALTFDAMTVNHTLEGFIPAFYLFGDGGFGLFFSFIVDVFAVLVLAAVVFFAFRRFVVRPKAYATTPLDSAVIYMFLTLVTLTYLYFEAFAIAHDPGTARLSFLGSALARLFVGSGLGHDAVSLHFKLAWWAHILAVYAFIAYVPHSKYLHMFAGPLNLLLKRDVPSGALDALDLEKSEVLGLERTADLTWKDGLDAFACMECGRCQDACPAFASGKPLSPKMIMFNLERSLLREERPLRLGKREELKPLVPDTFTEEEIWACTTCGACVHVCPVEIGHIDKIVGARRSRVLMEGRFPAELAPMFRGLESQANPWALSASKRAEWAEEPGIPHIGEVADAEALFWAGCFGAYDDEGRKTAAAMASVMKAAGVRFGILGTDEKCCGDSARRLGNEYLFQTLARANMELFLAHGVRKIVTICPHGYNTFRNEYPRLAESFSDLPAADRERLRSIEVISHPEYIQELLERGRLKLESRLRAAVYTYHDPCYLGRHNGIIEPPRLVLDAAVSGGRRELRNRGRRSFCCGAGGGLMWTEERTGRRVNHLRTEEVIETGAGLVVSACPFCQTMLRDGLRDKQAVNVEVLDIARVVAAALK
jgi:Fe-S oxidoreductase/nitrate reductase gamma subunit